MAGEDVRELLIRVNATTELLRSNLTAAERAVANFERDTNANLAKVDSRFATTGSAIDRLKVGLGGVSIAAAAAVSAFSAASFLRFAKEALDYAGSLGEVSQQLGVTAEDLQVYRFAATQVGLSQEEMDQGLEKLTKTLGEAALGAAKPTKVFDALGISIKNADGTIKTAGQAIPEIADALSKIEDPAKRAAIEIAIFGRAGQKLDTLLAGGSKAIDDLRTEAAKLGIVLSNEQIQKADETADKIAKMQFQLKQNIAGTVADNADAILALATGLASLVNWLGQAITGLNNFRVAHNRAVMQRLAQDAPEGSAMQKIAQSALDNERNYLRQGGLDAARLLNMSGGKRPPVKPTVDPDLEALRELLAGNGSKSKSKPKQIDEDAQLAIKTVGQLAEELGKIDQQSLRPKYGSWSDITGVDAQAEFDRARINMDDDPGVKRAKAIFDANMESLARQGDMVDDLAYRFREGFHGGTKAIWKDFESQGEAVIAQLLARLVVGAFSQGGIWGQGGLGGIFNAAVGSVFGGAFADGGSPPVGKISLVGERGPELFVPKVPGTVIPNGAMGGVTNHFDLRGAVVTERLYADMQRMADASVAAGAPHIIRASVQSTMRTITRPRING